MNPHSPALGAWLAGYRLERVLGQGGLSRVYLATRPHDGLANGPKPNAPGRSVALKVFDFSGPDGDALRQTFRREVAAGERLVHPCILQVEDAGESGTLAYIAMELMASGDLAHPMARAALAAWPAAVCLGERLAQALAHAHARGVVHRDVKPANILLQDGPATAKLSDFGLARLADAQRSRTGVLAGTPSYMAPEQLAETAVDARADLYSLGVVLFELLAGRLPYEAHSLGELLRQVGGNAAAPPLRLLKPGLPPALGALVAALLCKRPEGRPAAAQSVAQELRAIAQREAP